MADSVDQATEDLVREWAVQRRPAWAIDTGSRTTGPVRLEAPDSSPISVGAALSRARLEAERDAILAAVPPDPGPAIRRVEARLDDLRHAGADLDQGRGAYADTPVGEAARGVVEAQAQRVQAERFAGEPHIGWRARRSWAASARRWAEEEAAARTSWEQLSIPESERLAADTQTLEAERQNLRGKKAQRETWLTARPEAARRLARLDRELAAIEERWRLQAVLARQQQSAAFRDVPTDSRHPALEIGR